MRKRGTHTAGTFLLGNSEIMGHGCLANSLGAFLTNTRVKMLKVALASVA